MADASPSIRQGLPLLALGGVALLAGLFAALVLLGLPIPALRPSLPEVHGPVMVLGAVGTLIALERAVALGKSWALLAPLTAGLGALVLITFGPILPGKLLLATGGVVLVLIYAALWQRQESYSLLAQIAGAAAWYAASLLWLGGFTIPEIVPWLAGFTVLTIAGERLELAFVGMPRSHAQRWFVAALAGVVVGLTTATIWPQTGHRLLGVALLGLVWWLMRYDVARRTIRAQGLPRFVAVGLLVGYAWLAVAGLLWAVTGPSNAGARYDATLHALFLGYVMSMIYVHAPVILPAVLRIPFPFHRVLYLPLLLLHGSLLVRILVGDGFGETGAWRWAGVANVISVLMFLGLSVVLVRRSARRPSSRHPVRPVVTSLPAR